MQNISIGNYSSIFKRVCFSSSDKDLAEFLENLEKNGIRKRNSFNDYEGLLVLLKPYFDNSNSFTLKENKIQESLLEYKKLLVQKVAAGENVEYLQFLITNLEKQLGFSKKPEKFFWAKNQKSPKAAVFEIFEFYANLSEKILPKMKNSISLSNFIKFCRDFKITEFPHITIKTLSSIFKRNSLYYKLMHRDNFIVSLSEISKLIYPYYNKLELLYQYMGINDLSYKSNLKPLMPRLSYSSSEKAVKRAQPLKNEKNSIIKSKFYEMPNVNYSKTSANKTRTPITWKLLNETDIKSLGQEFDVRDLIVDTPKKD